MRAAPEAYHHIFKGLPFAFISKETKTYAILRINSSSTTEKYYSIARGVYIGELFVMTVLRWS